MLEGGDSGGSALASKQVVDGLGGDGPDRGGTHPFGRTDCWWDTAASDQDESAEQGITADIELLPSARIHEAFDRLGRGDVRYRFVLDLADLDQPAA